MIFCFSLCSHYRWFTATLHTQQLHFTMLTYVTFTVSLTHCPLCLQMSVLKNKLLHCVWFSHLCPERSSSVFLVAFFLMENCSEGSVNLVLGLSVSISHDRVAGHLPWRKLKYWHRWACKWSVICGWNCDERVESTVNRVSVFWCWPKSVSLSQSEIPY